MSLPQTTSGYSLRPDEGEALWLNGARLVIKAAAEQTEGRLGALEYLAPRGFAAPLHIHRNEDEIFLVLAGEVRFQLADAVISAVPGSLFYGPRGVRHSFHVDSPEAHMILFFGPAGLEGFFREGGKLARAAGLPPVDESFVDLHALTAISKRYGTETVGPPLPPK